MSLAGEGGSRRENKHNEDYDEPVTSRRKRKVEEKRRSEATQDEKGSFNAEVRERRAFEARAEETP